MWTKKRRKVRKKEFKRTREKYKKKRYIPEATFPRVRRAAGLQRCPPPRGQAYPRAPKHRNLYFLN